MPVFARTGRSFWLRPVGELDERRQAVTVPIPERAVMPVPCQNLHTGSDLVSCVITRLLSRTR